MYEGEDYDIAGFCVGVVEASEIIDGSKVKAGDALIALASSGSALQQFFADQDPGSFKADLQQTWRQRAWPMPAQASPSLN